jgi:hypothetical protein
MSTEVSTRATHKISYRVAPPTLLSCMPREALDITDDFLRRNLTR